MSIKLFFGKCKNVLNRVRRNLWLTRLRKKNHNHTFSLITNNCVGGVICHDLGEQFRSPTVNLWIPNACFLPFAQNLRYYLSCEIEEMHDESKPYPVGRIVPRDEQHIPIVLYFQHYSSFEEASAKWKERSKRVNYDHLYYIWDYDEKVCTEELLAFDRWDVHKLVILREPISGIQHFEITTCYRNDPQHGKLLKIIEKTGKRYLDEIDYLGFLNIERT